MVQSMNFLTSQMRKRIKASYLDVPSGSQEPGGPELTHAKDLKSCAVYQSSPFNIL